MTWGRGVSHGGILEVIGQTMKLEVVRESFIEAESKITFELEA